MWSVFGRKLYFGFFGIDLGVDKNFEKPKGNRKIL